MILKPFHVVSNGTRYQFVDRKAIDSESERDLIQQLMLVQLELMQDDAKCAALGILEVGTIDNLELGVYDDSDLVGVFFVAALDYRSGPWADLIDWEVVSNDPAVFHARPMPGFPALVLDDALDLSVDAAHHIMNRRLETVGGHEAQFSRLSWAIYEGRDDPNSRAMKRVHDRAKSDARFLMTEAQDPAEAGRTRVDIELA